MFGNNKKKDNLKSSLIPVASSHSINSLVQDTVVEGKVSAVNDIRVDGTIKGDLTCNAKIILGVTGYVEGTIRCENAVIEGKFYGNLFVKHVLTIGETAKIEGELNYGKLTVHAGASIQGSLKVHSDGASNGEANKIAGTTAAANQSSSAEQ
jgi:cytoskeletal protein CcmA (bactofilin family)